MKYVFVILRRSTYQRWYLLCFCINCNILVFQIDLPSDNVDHPFEILVDEPERSDLDSVFSSEMTTSLKCIEGEGVDATLWGSYIPETVQRPCSGTGINQTTSPTSSSSTAVEALSSQMVSDIIQEVTRKSSTEPVIAEDDCCNILKPDSFHNQASCCHNCFFVIIRNDCCNKHLCFYFRMTRKNQLWS